MLYSFGKGFRVRQNVRSKIKLRITARPEGALWKLAMLKN